MKDASSQVWFVTGSSRGLGRALTEAALAAGHRVVATARSTADVSHFADHYGDRVKAVPLDVTQPEQALRAVKVAVDAFGRIDVLVNNAGYANTDSVEDIALDDFRQAAKFAVAGFSEVLINEVAGLGIQVTIVEPGGFATDWAGASMTVHPAKPDYEATVGATNKRLRGNPNAARGVPEKAARVLLALAVMEKQPRRLLLGSDAYVLARATLLEMAASDDAHRTLSASTDADGLPDFAETDVGKAMLTMQRR
jgi:NAD(P)-dependent dehydrogenase (short-subunit alcohol dehydrogenase family)